MKSLGTFANRMITSASEAAAEFGNQIVESLRKGLQWVKGWHQARMEVDPRYPFALMTGGGALIRIAVPSRVLSEALVQILTEVFGNRTRSHGKSTNRWTDDEPRTLWDREWDEDE